ncbi:MAG: type I restriction endonuclease subunit R [Clostridiales bacterium]|jgi:type I restriction enzyme R subunit|nr:type I restriction endonuclease subunit R [Clostridiales bacterium]
MREFGRESDFEEALIKMLFTKGWEENVLKYKTEEELIQNWADILFENNRSVDRLNDYPLTKTEMDKIIEQIIQLRTPLNLNTFINGKTISIIRDNPDDIEHVGKEISLKIYDREEIAAGQSRYQIAQQPQFDRKNPIRRDRRGDLMLLINGMPVIHIELKRSGIPVSHACRQIEQYAHEGMFTGLFSLIQIFVAMEPNETLYFANPGPDGVFDKDFYFHWADFNNEPINNWEGIASHLLSIPMAHQLIGFYTVPDSGDGKLKVMRSYQYYAANAISDKVTKTKWHDKNPYGGYVWHTTGSGKTLTSFKTAQLIANTNDADKVVFLVDRIDLGTQALEKFRGYAEISDNVQETETTDILLTKLKSSNPSDTLIVSSIQKMSNIKELSGYNAADIWKVNEKRVVFVVDEAHRSTFGDMLATIKKTFPSAIFFGFTGTPIVKGNEKKDLTTADVFGDELHKYSIADGIRDKNVLGFDPYRKGTFKERDLRRIIALEQAKAKDEADALIDKTKSKIYHYYMYEAPMAGYHGEDGYVKGIEDYLKTTQYTNYVEHKTTVIKDILNNWTTLSRNRKYHAILATHSIKDAVEYYQLFKEQNPLINITSLFDPNIDNCEGAIYKGDGLVEIIKDYNNMFGLSYTVGSHDKMRKDICLRLAHKAPYDDIENDKSRQIDLLIVVDQMLTGYDSKWINTLYLDKMLEGEHIIQAFSRTNRLSGPDKPFGTICYYMKPYTMEKRIERAFEMYSGNRPAGVFVNKLPENISKMNDTFKLIKRLFETADIPNFEKLPDDIEVKKEFAKLFREFNRYFESAKVQGFVWSKREYSNGHETIKVEIDENQYAALRQRYGELAKPTNGEPDSPPYDLEAYLTEARTGTIDFSYMNSRYKKWLKAINRGDSVDAVKKALDELHLTFALLTQEDQKYANMFLNDIRSGEIYVEDEKSLSDYIVEYKIKAKNDQIHRFANAIGICEEALRKFMEQNINEYNINEYGRFNKLKTNINMQKARRFIESKKGSALKAYEISSMIDLMLRKFILRGGVDVDEIEI